MSYYMYLRKSRKDDEIDSDNLEDTLLRHERTLLELAHKMGVTIDAIYREVVSGETIAARPKMQELLLRIEDGSCDGVFVMEVERLARGNTRDQGYVAEAFQYSNTKIITPLRTYDPQDDSDQEYFEFSLFMSRREYQTINRRMRAGIKASIKEGKYTGNITPYGYNREKLKGEKGWILVLNKDEAPIVKQIYEWYAYGELQADGSIQQMGTTNIARKLIELGIPTRKGGPWSVATLHTILKNPVYIGKLRYGSRPSTKKLVNGKTSRQRLKADEFILAHGRHTPIIEEELFNKVQEIYKVRSHPVKNKDLKNPLAKIIVCGKCGKRMQRRPYDNRKIDSILCPTLGCNNIGCDLDNLEKAILKSLKKWMKSYELDTSVMDQKDKENTLIQALDTNIKYNNKKLSELEVQLDNIYDLFEKGIYDNEVFIKRSRKLTEEQDRLSKIIKKQTDELNYEKEIIDAKETIVPKIRSVLDAYQKMESIYDKNQALLSVLEKVVYLKNTRRTDENDTFEITIFPKIPRKKSENQ